MKFKLVASLLGLTFFFGVLARAQEKPDTWGSVGAGYNYLLTENTGQHWTSSHGWYVLPTFNINKAIGVFGDFTNFYARGLNVHGDTFGPFHAFANKTRVTPFMFIGGGVVRVSKGGAVSTSGAWLIGGGLMVRITRWVSFETIPIEYVMATPNGMVGNNFLARAGLAITVPRKENSTLHGVCDRA